MPIPQVTDRIKEAPAVVLRALFAGIGQLLLAADKLRTRPQEPADQPASSPPDGAQPQRVATAKTPAARPAEQPAATAAPPPSPPAPAAPARKAAPPPPTAKKRTPQTGKTATRAGTAARKPAPVPAKPTTSASAAEKPATTQTRPSTARAGKPSTPLKPAAATAAKKASDTPPIPQYDDLSVASLRARLRVLDPVTVRALLAYEKGHAGRDAVITMFERRLSKLGTDAG